MSDKEIFEAALKTYGAIPQTLLEFGTAVSLFPGWYGTG